MHNLSLEHDLHSLFSLERMLAFAKLNSLAAMFMYTQTHKCREIPSEYLVSYMDFFMHFLRTLVGILDDCFEGYYTEEMIESQV